MRLALLCMFTVATLPVSAWQQEGLPPEWDVRKMLSSFTAQVKRLNPLLDQVNPSDWKQKEAGEVYLNQWNALRNEIGYLEHTVAELSEKPDLLSKALEAFFRLQAVNSMTGSLIEGIRRHQNPAVAELLEGVLNEISPYSQQFRAYLLDLAVTKETECKIADEEAQRCRAQIVRESPEPASSRRGSR